MTEEQLRSEIMANPAVIERMAFVQEALSQSRMSATQAAQSLLDTIHAELKR